MKNNQAIVEGILFLSGENGITIGELIKNLETDEIQVYSILEKIEEQYLNESHGIYLVKTAQSYKFATKDQYFDNFKRYADDQYNELIPKSSLETLAIVAYNQPISKLEIEEIKGVSATYTVQYLINKNLIEIIGKTTEGYRSNLYSVTDRFLDYIGINTLEELPDLKNFKINESFGKQEDLFKEDIDIKDIKKRLLEDVEFIPKEFELEEVDIKIKDIKLFNEKESEGYGKNTEDNSS